MPDQIQRSSLKELRRHGTVTFPCAFYRADSVTDDPAFPFVVKHHWQDEPEIIYFEQGSYHTELDTHPLDVEGPCFCFINRGELHHLRTTSDTYQEQAFVFSPAMISFDSADPAQEELIGPLAAHRMLLPGFLFPDHPAFREVQAEFLKIRLAFYRECPGYQEASDARQRQAGSPGDMTDAFSFPEQLTVRTASSQLRVKAALLNLLAILNEHGLLTASEPTRNPRVESLKTVLTYIQRNYQHKIYLADLAALVNMNEQYFCRFFKNAIGKTPVSYINDYRIRRAAVLLLETELPVMDICMECGFNNLGHFMKEFKKSTQLTPLQFRRKKLKETTT